MVNIERIRQDFPLLHQQVHDAPLAYLDNAATTQKPEVVMHALEHYYRYDNANVHRSVYALGERATASYEASRLKVQAWLNAPLSSECIFVRGTTEGINLVACSYVLPRLHEGDEIIITYLEHHANIVPWQMICEQKGAKLRVVAIDEFGCLDLESYDALFSEHTRFVAITHASNALGTLNPIQCMIEKAHEHGVLVLVDGAQAVPHHPIDVQTLGCDFYVFSGHKMYGPTGIGVLWGKTEHLEVMRPYQGGGEMISSVSFEHTTYAPLPYKFEAGTPAIAEAIGLGAAVTYLQSLPWASVMAYEAELLAYATASLLSLSEFKIYGPTDLSKKVPLISFVHDTIHAHDLATILDSRGVAMRSGHHCAMPLMTYLKVPATMRLSLSFYNTKEEIDQAIAALIYACEVFG